MVIIWGIFWLIGLLSDISANQKIFLTKLDLVLEWQTDIKRELTINSEEHKKFALRQWTIDYVNKYFNLK